MPIASGAIGRVQVIAAPGTTSRLGRSGGQPIGTWRQVGMGHRALRSQPFASTSIYVTGITKDSTGAVLGGCTVHLFRASDDVEVDQNISDGSGNYSLICAGSGTFYVVAYKAGAPDLGGTTVNTLIGS